MPGVFWGHGEDPVSLRGLFGAGVGIAALTLCSSIPTDTHAQGQLGRQVVPLLQEVRMTIDADQPDYSGSVGVDLDVRESTDVIHLHSLGPKLTRIELTDGAGAVVVQSEVDEYGYLSLTASRPLQVGAARLEIDFTNEFDTQASSLYRVVTGGDSYIFTQFEAVDAREAFPCWDEPAFKFPYQVTVTVPEAHLAVSNTPIESESSQNGWRTVVFRKTPPLPSYLLALATGPLDTVPLQGLSFPARLVTVRGRSYLGGDAVTRTAASLHALEEYFGRPHPFEKLDLIAVPEFWYGAMENPGAIVFNESGILYDPALVGVRERRRFTNTMTHELAHLWFGDLVTMSWWDDLWLNESFATWAAEKIVHELYPEYRRDLSVLSGRRNAMRIDARPSARAIRQPIAPTVNLGQLADALAYDKGETVLRMIETWIGPEVFREGVVSYLDAHAWENAVAADLWNAVSHASGYDLTPVMSSFLEQSGVPLVEVEVLDGGRVRLKQSRYAIADGDGKVVASEQLWQIPLALRYPTGDGTEVHRLLLTEREHVEQLPISDRPAWVHPNANETGYYLWKTEPQTLSFLVENRERLLSDGERIGLVHNLVALLRGGSISADLFLELTEQCARDPQPEVVDAVLEGWEAIRAPLVTPELKDEFAIYVRGALQPAAARWGLLPRPGEEEGVTLLRPSMLHWLTRDGEDAVVQALADSLTAVYLDGSGECPPSLVQSVLGISARRGDVALFEQFRNRFERADPQARRILLSAMGDFRRPDVVEVVLRFVAEGPLRPNERTSIPTSMSEDHELQDRAYRWMKENYEEMAAKIPADRMAYMPRYVRGCSPETLADARAFFSDPARKPAGTDVELRKAEDEVGACVSLRQREGDAAASYLQRLALAP
jgi:cytosol alanyl aminopeptidase